MSLTIQGVSEAQWNVNSTAYSLAYRHAVAAGCNNAEITYVDVLDVTVSSGNVRRRQLQTGTSSLTVTSKIKAAAVREYVWLYLELWLFLCSIAVIFYI